MKKSPKSAWKSPKKTKSGQKIQNSHPVLKKLEKGPQNIQLIKNRKYLKYSKNRRISELHVYTLAQLSAWNWNRRVAIYYPRPIPT